MIVAYIIMSIGCYFLLRCFLGLRVNEKMYRIAIKEKGDPPFWYLKWLPTDFFICHPFTFRINKYIEKVRSGKL